MKLYHGTTVGGLKTLSAKSRNKDKTPVLYLTDNWSYSLFYIRDREIDFVTCGVDTDGIVHYDEKFQNQLKALYKGMTGYIYEVEADAQPTKTNGIYVTLGDAKVLRQIPIADAYDVIQEEIHKGNVSFVPFEALTEEQRELNREGMRRLLRSGHNLSVTKKEFLHLHFPEEWQEVYEEDT